MIHDPFRIEGPAVISFSGGRTSGYMLWRILQAHQWILPDDVKVIFANTGKEMPETLDFVLDCSVYWNVPVTWVEYRRNDDPQKRWKEVSYITASRRGEPFEDVILERGQLPNPVARFCTMELKIRAMKLYCQQVLGWNHWTMAVGLRADESRRVAKLRSPSADVYERCAPLADADIGVQDVMRFWFTSAFDLALAVDTNGVSAHGNCDCCFLKQTDKLASIIRERPERALWWIKQEEVVAQIGKAKGAALHFRHDRPSYASMYRMATQHGELFPFDDEPLQDCMCTD